MSTQLWGDLGQKDDCREEGEGPEVLVHAIGRRREEVPASTVASQCDREAVGNDVGRGELPSLGPQERHSQLHVHAVAARPGVPQQIAAVAITGRNRGDTTALENGLEIDVTIGAEAHNVIAELSGTPQGEYGDQHADRCGHRVS